MHSKRRKHGFTLVELLTALAIVGLILSAVYGSYRATTRSMGRHRARVVLLEDGRVVLEAMARQVRCSYTTQGDDGKRGSLSESLNDEAGHEEGVPYLTGGEGDVVLELVTTAGLLPVQASQSGLYKAAYRYERSEGALYYRQQAWQRRAGREAEEPAWRLLVENVRDVALTFHDGQEWRRDWDSREAKQDCRAVRIELLLASGDEAVRLGETAGIDRTRAREKSKPAGDRMEKPFKD